MSDDNPKSDDADISLSGRAIALAIVENDSLAMVLQESGMKLREFIVHSFVSDSEKDSESAVSPAVAICRQTCRNLFEFTPVYVMTVTFCLGAIR